MHRLSWLSSAVIAFVLAACASSPPTLVALPAATTPGARQAPDAVHWIMFGSAAAFLFIVLLAIFFGFRW